MGMQHKKIIMVFKLEIDTTDLSNNEIDYVRDDK